MSRKVSIDIRFVLEKEKHDCATMWREGMWCINEIDLFDLERHWRKTLGYVLICVITEFFFCVDRSFLFAQLLDFQRQTTTQKASARERERRRKKNASFCHTYLISKDKKAGKKNEEKTSHERDEREKKKKNVIFSTSSRHADGFFACVF